MGGCRRYQMIWLVGRIFTFGERDHSYEDAVEISVFYTVSEIEEKWGKYFELMNVNLCCGLRVGVLDV